MRFPVRETAQDRHPAESWNIPSASPLATDTDRLGDPASDASAEPTEPGGTRSPWEGSLAEERPPKTTSSTSDLERP